MSDTTRFRFEEMRARLAAFRRYKRLFLVGLGILLTLAAIVLVGLFAFMLDMIFHLPPAARLTLWGITLIALAVGLVGFVLYPLIRRFSDEMLAMEIGQKIEQIGDRMIDALQLWKTVEKNPYRYSISLAESSIQSAADLSSRHNFKETISRRPLVLVGRILAVGAVLFILLAVVFPGRFNESALRFRYPSAETLQHEVVSFTVSPGNVKLLEGTPLTIDVTTHGPQLQNIEFVSKQAGDDWRAQNLSTTTPNQFSMDFASLRKGFQYQVRAGQWESETYTVTVTERPIVTEIQLRFEYPEYTNLPPVTREINDGEVVALKGTKVFVTAKSNNVLDFAELVFQDSTTIELDIRNQKQMEGQFTVVEDGNYHINLRDRDGVSNQSPLVYGIHALADEIPLVRILEPGQDIDIGEDMQVYLLIAGLDDYGFTRLNLSYYTNRDTTVYTEKIATYRGNSTDLTQEYNWNLTALELLPEDVVTYWVELYDNDAISGPKKGVSSTYTIRFPSLYELYAEVDEQQTEQIMDVDEMLREGRDLKQKMEELAREMQKDPEVDWQKQKEIEKALEEQKKMAEEFQEMAESMDQTMEKLEKNAEANFEVMEKIEQIQELMNEVATPEMKEALQKMQEAIESLDPEEIQRALEEMNLTQEEMLERLDRTLGMLKELQKEQRMNAAVKKAEELVKRQEAIEEELQKMDDGDMSQEDRENLAKEQEGIKQDLEQLMKDMEQLKEMMENEPSVAEQLENVKQEVQEQNTPSEMQELSQMMRQSQSSGGQCQSKSQKIKSALTEMSEGMQQAQSMMQSQMQEQLAEEMRQETQDLISLSKQQEALKSEISENLNSPYNIDPGEMADRQMALKQSLERLSDRIFETSKKSMSVRPEMMRKLGEAMNEMENAMSQMQGNSTTQMLGPSNKAMAALNDAARQMMSASSQNNSSQSGSSGSQAQQQMQALGQQQQGLNSQTQSLFNQMQGQSGLSLEARQQMARLAAEQQQIQKGMEELAREVKNRDDILGRLDDMVKEAENVVKDLQDRNIDRRTLERQQRILSRLLDAQKSMRQREYSRKREAQTAEDIRRRSPNELPADLLERKRNLHDDLLRSMREGVPVEYEGLIKSYFQALSQDNETGQGTN